MAAAYKHVELLYRELADNIARISQLAGGISPDEARIRPTADSWSLLEIICHLYDEEREDFRQRLDMILHHPGQPWPPIDPPSWVGERKYQERDLEAMLEQLVAERQRSLAWLQTLKDANWQAEYITSRGPLTASDMLAAWVAHDILHMRQLVELRYARLQQIATPHSLGYAGDW